MFKDKFQRMLLTAYAIFGVLLVFTNFTAVLFGAFTMFICDKFEKDEIASFFTEFYNKIKDGISKIGKTEEN